ncbi:MAG: YbaK/EbsC family protein [Chloroflexi bacterium]|nr:YbaK/EbsC family protein [Chloroflexota bacterium]
MTAPLSPSAQKVKDALEARGFPHRIIELPESARTSVEAARAIGCQVGQIVKSLIFRGGGTQRAILVVASGSNRVNEKGLSELVSEPVERPDADYVRLHTGFSIGGVPPIGHPEPIETFIDEDLLTYEEIWAAAGTPRAVFSLTPGDLIKMTGGRVVSIK